MSNKNLGVYLNDHLSGSVLAIELIDHLRAAQPGTPLAHMLSELKAEIEQERGELEALIQAIGHDESAPRKAVAWLGEKFAQLKLRFEDAAGAVHLFESLEVLSLGIEGKRGLWQALAALTAQVPELRGHNYQQLIERAEVQRRQVEDERLRAVTALIASD